MLVIMKRSLILPIIALSASLSIAQSTTQSAVKIYASNAMIFELSERGAGQITGLIRMSGSEFPVTGTIAGGKINATFRGLDGADVPFTGSMAEGKLTMDVNDHHYELKMMAPEMGGIGARIEPVDG